MVFDVFLMVKNERLGAGSWESVKPKGSVLPAPRGWATLGPGAWGGLVHLPRAPAARRWPLAWAQIGVGSQQAPPRPSGSPEGGSALPSAPVGPWLTWWILFLFPESKKGLLLT